MPGLFITFEGGEGSGKTTQVAKLAAKLAKAGYPLVQTKEPGGTQIGQVLRGMLLSKEPPLCQITELLLMIADRAQHVTEVIRPALQKGTIVLCDRYLDSTLAYQGGGRGHDQEMLAKLNALACDGVYPTRTYLLDVTVKEGLTRAGKRGTLDAFEQETLDFHSRVLSAYRYLALRNENLKRIKIISASRTVEQVFAEIWEDCQELLPARRVA